MVDEQEMRIFTIRTERELLDKIGYIAKYEMRSKNKQIEQLIKQYIREFEKAHGEITL